MLSATDRHTEVVRGIRETTRVAAETFARAEVHLDAVAGSLAPPLGLDVEIYRKGFADLKEKGVRVRAINPITRNNLENCKRLLELGLVIEMRHLEDVNGNFMVTEKEYLAAPSVIASTPVQELIHSNDPAVVSQNQYIFDLLWNRATPAKLRFDELERGIVPPTLQVIRDQSKIQELFVRLVEQSKTDILLLMPSINALHREQRIGVLDALRKTSERGVSVMVMSPLNPSVESAASYDEQFFKYRPVPEAKTPETVTVLVVDKNTSLVIEQKDDSNLVFVEAIGAATYSTSNSTVLATTRFFERLWDEVGLHDRESRSRRTAELLQDILAHDIRNYNQASRTGAEMLKISLDQNARMIKEISAFVDNLKGGSKEVTEQVQKLKEVLDVNQKAMRDANRVLDMTISGIDGSTRLIERAKKLGRIISEREVDLRPFDVESSIRRSLFLVTQAYSQKKIDATLSIKKQGAQVVADDLLDEVFTNILSNSVHYTESDHVAVEIDVEEAGIEGKPGPYLKITFTDWGRGIPDSMKEEVFARYLKTAHGTGLGLSIVYALVVERYSGEVKVMNRIEGDYTKGTRVLVWLPLAVDEK